MTKRTLYAVAELPVSLLLAAVGLPLASPFVPCAAAQGAACATCVAVSVTPNQAPSLPAELDGMEVLLRVAPGAEAGAADSLSSTEKRGGRPGLFITGLPDSSPEASILAASRRVVVAIAAPQGGQTPDEYAFVLKTRLTAIRAAAPATLMLGIAADAATMTFVLSRELGSYVDFVIVSGTAPFAASGIEIWRAVPSPAASVQEVLALTKASLGITHWLWQLPDDTAIAGSLAAELARVAALPAGVDPSQAAGERVGESVEVVGARGLTVDEIVARHQAAAARQAAIVHEIISSGTLTLTFEAPGFPAPVSISSETTIYTTRTTTEIEQRAIRVNGIEFSGKALPRLPIIEPERVASPPLAIELTNRYRYRLAGRETVAATPCYVVAFEPDPHRPADGRPLFRGQAWIAMDSFAMLKVAAAQTGLRGAIVASEQTDEFKQVNPGIWLLVHSDVRQMYEGAAHRTPIHRVLAIGRTEVNPSDFKDRRTHAYTEAPVMLRDTPEGYRYLKRGPPAPGKEGPDIAGRADRVRTLIGGVIIDPNISVPLPFAGVSYVDFNLFGTGTQFNGFFGGTYGQLAFSVPSLGGSRWQLAGRAFGIASSYNDRAFVNGREIYEEDIRQRPSAASVWLLHPLTPRISVRAGYDLDYTHLAGGDQTARDFVVPADQIVHGARVSLDLQRAGWNASIWWNPARRTGWRAWGRSRPGEYDPAQRDFQRYGATLARSTVLTPHLVARAEAAWMAGRDLDRFSRYSFGTFDNRLRGYPSALIRYDRGGVVRTAVAWGAAKLIRVDGFFDSAWAHDPGFGRGLRNYSGAGGAIEAPAPSGILLALEWGYGFRGVNTNGSLGTQVLRISAVKVF